MTPQERHLRDLLNVVMVRLRHFDRDFATRAGMAQEAAKLADRIRAGLDRTVGDG